MPNVPNTSTYLSDLFDPEIVGDIVRRKLTSAIRFAPLCTVDSTLVGRPGDTITLPSFAYIGDAADVAEGADIALTKLVASNTQVKVKKAGKGLQLTDEAMMSGFGDPAQEVANQIMTSIAAKVDIDVLAVLTGIASGMTFTGAAASISADDVSDALVLLGEDITDVSKVLLVSPAAYGVIRKTDGWIPNTELGAEMIIRGTVGMVHGCQVAVSNRLTNAAYIVCPGALALYLKRDTLIEYDRDIVNKSTVVTADKHYATYLYDSSKAIKLVGAGS